MEIVVAIIIAAGVPSALFGLFLKRMEKQMDKREKVRERMENDRKKNEVLLIRMTMASLSLGEATAKAVQRIPDAHCNGDMHTALSYAESIKHTYKDFVFEKAVDDMM